MATFRATLALFLLAGAMAIKVAPERATTAMAEAQVSAVALLQVSSERKAEALLDSVAHTKPRNPNPASWFGGFSDGESTYTYGGTLGGRNVNPEINVLGGWEPSHQDPSNDQVRSAKWFMETKSGGPREAWQTLSSVEHGNMAGNRVQTGTWFGGTGHTEQQDYILASGFANEKSSIPASWFDGHVEQLDGFGREKMPGLESPRNYLDWEEKSVNTSLSCKGPGCMANATLTAPFDAQREVFKNCRLSVFFHPTDFDDQYSGERVEWVQVNNKQVSFNCHPFQAGCNKTAQRPLLPCVSDLSIDHLMPATGSLAIAAKIPKVVDECPYNGNLLSAVPMVTCLVSKKPPSPNKSALKGKPVTVKMDKHEENCVTRMPLQCATRGCASEISIPIKPKCVKAGPCMLSINVSQTDYDETEGNAELIEYIKVEGKEVSSKVKPGKNPCTATWKGGKSGNRTAYSFVALTNHAVNASSGKVLVEGKISEFVDECASNGYLFDALAEVTCGKKTAMFLQQKAVVDAKPRRNPLRGNGS